MPMPPALPRRARAASIPAVTITLAKRKGTNATVISEAAEKKIADCADICCRPT